MLPSHFKIMARTAAVVVLTGSSASGAPAPDAGTIVAINSLDVRAAAETNFAASCTNIAYFGYCRIEADCTPDGSAVSADNKANLQHTFLDLGQCIGYDSRSTNLLWRSKTVAHWQSTYCAPCSQCTIDTSSTKMTCQCRYTNSGKNHATHITLSDHVSNNAGVLSCLNVAGDPDHND